MHDESNVKSNLNKATNDDRKIFDRATVDKIT